MEDQILRCVSDFKVDANDWNFLSIVDAPQVHSKGFFIGEKIRVSFDSQSGGQVALAAINPPLDAPFYRLSPVNMGAARWYSIEMDVPTEDVVNIGQVVPWLEAAAEQSVALFATLRIGYINGQTEDISSAQIELRRVAAFQSFPISMSDIPLRASGQIKSARVIFFVEARNVDLDIYRFGIATLPAAQHPERTNVVSRLQEAHAQQLSGIHRRRLAPDADSWEGEVTGHRAVGEEVFVDFEPGNNRSMTLAKQSGRLQVDWSATSTGEYRNLEFRFNGIENTGKVMAVIYAKGAATPALTEATAFIRSYDSMMNWKDTRIPGTLPFFPESGSLQRVVDLSPLLPDDQGTHHFGVMVFFAPEANLLEIEEMNVYVFDREAV